MWARKVRIIKKKGGICNGGGRLEWGGGFSDGGGHLLLKSQSAFLLPNPAERATENQSEKRSEQKTAKTTFASKFRRGCRESRVRKTVFFLPPRFHVCAPHSCALGVPFVPRPLTPASPDTSFNTRLFLKGLPRGP